ncbi:macro domain-containing protein [Streptomyces sp. E2N166]|uniref:macro domain-containing protein n=1 Tax=Streptomyces sp. E2N166 TaxID=1851909 RepID=UPI000EF69A5F|nr:macro domain-containing protein [Streptomyces sp. E2N166]
MFAGSVMAAFGGVSAVVQFVGQVWPAAIPAPAPVTAASALLCLAWGVLRSRPTVAVRQEFRRPQMAVAVGPGDLFDESAHLVVGFCDTFDTDVRDGVVISGASVQGQLLERRYDGDARRLDDELDAALRTAVPVARESREDKPYGKLGRYPVGTVAVLGSRPRLVFGVAYSRLGNDCVARSSTEELWLSLSRVWDAVYRHGQLDCVAVPLIGSGLSRLHGLDEESLLRLILLSFITHSRERVICRELRVVLRPAELERVDLTEVAAFLGVLAAADSGGAG